jgi:ribose transport system substrate-binding protein
LWVSNSRPTGETEKIVIGASLLTQQHPFYMLLADAMKKEVEIDGVSLQLSIANKDLKTQLSDVEDFITKGVNAKGVKGAMYSFT